jgi:hypothetical protein
MSNIRHLFWFLVTCFGICGLGIMKEPTNLAEFEKENIY